MDSTGPDNYYIGGQVQDKYGEYNYNTVVLKQIKLQANNIGELWKKPTTLNLLVYEYEIVKMLSTSEAQLNHVVKRRLLCQSDYYFFDDPEEDYLTKCQLTIKDNKGTLCFNKTYNQVDNVNRRFFTNQ